MINLLVLSIFPILLKLLIGDYSNDLKKKKFFIITCGIFIVCVMGLRDMYAGTRDTEIYCGLYNNIHRYSSLHDFLKSQDIFETNILFSEAGFYIFIWCLSKIFPHHQYFLLITSVIMVWCVLRFVWNNSEDILVSIVLFLCLGLFTFYMNGIRQSLAMSICLIAYDLVKRKRFVLFCLATLLAMLFHKSAILFLVVLPISLLKPKFSSLAIFSIFIVLFVIFSDRLTIIFDNLADKNYSETEAVESGGVITLFIYVLTLGMTILFNREKSKKDIFLCILLTALGMVLYLARYFTVHIYERLSYYFLYFPIILIPSLINNFKDKEKNVLYIVVITLAIALFAYRLNGGVFRNFEFFF